MQAHAEGRRVVLIVDEAQTLSPELLEQVRLLTNLETSKQKLLQIILIGQPELRELLDRPEMRQIAQRITGRYHLEPLRKDDTRAYVSHRLRVAGAQSDIFTKRAVNALYRHSRGIPRLINVIADRALLAAYTKDQRSVDARLVVGGGRRGIRHPAQNAVVADRDRDGRRRGRRCSASRTWAKRRACPSAAPEQFLGAPAPPRRQTRQPTCPSSRSRRRDRTAPSASAEEPRPRAATIDGVARGPEVRVDAPTTRSPSCSRSGARLTTPRAASRALQAQEHGLRCLYQRRGTLGELRRVNWPTILSLVTPDGTEHPVVVTALGYDHAQLVANGSTFELPLAELSYSWFGDHLLLWRPGDAPARDLAPGVDDVGVRWLRDTLAKLAGEPALQSSLDGLRRRARAARARVPARASAHRRRHRRRAHADRDVGRARPPRHAALVKDH